MVSSMFTVELIEELNEIGIMLTSMDCRVAAAYVQQPQFNEVNTLTQQAHIVFKNGLSFRATGLFSNSLSRIEFILDTRDGILDGIFLPYKIAFPMFPETYGWIGH